MLANVQLTLDVILQSWVQPQTFESKTELEEGLNPLQILASYDITTGDFRVGIHGNQII